MNDVSATDTLISVHSAYYLSLTQVRANIVSDLTEKAPEKSKTWCLWEKYDQHYNNNIKVIILKIQSKIILKKLPSRIQSQ